MSKTLSLKKPEDAPTVVSIESPASLVQAFTSEQLVAMLQAARLAEGKAAVDPTMDLSIDALPPHVIADRSNLPPVDSRSAAPVQLPGKAHGSFSLNGIPLMVPQTGDINPATGAFYTQIGPRPKTQISPTPSRRFDGR